MVSPGRTNPAVRALERLWFRHEVQLHPRPQRAALGVVEGPAVPVRASVSAQARTVRSEAGEEVVVAATLAWSPFGPVPEIGATVTLPEEFGLKGRRKVVTARLAASGTGITPDHVEVTLL